MLPLVVALLVLLAAPASAALQPPAVMADRAAANLVLIQSGDVVPEDLYAVGYRVVIEGTVDGDVLAFATQDVLITGHVTGSVTAAASSVVIEGTVDGSVRATGGSVTVTGDVGQDLVAGASSVTVSGSVGRDVLAWCVNLDATGTIGRDLGGQSIGIADLGGTIEGDVDLTVNRMNVMSGTVVGGTLGYRSSQDAVIGSGVTVGRQIVHREPVRPNVRVEAVWMLTKLVGVVMMLLIGLLMFWAAPKGLDRAVASLRRAPFRTFVIGIAGAVLPPLIIGIGFVGAVTASPELALPALLIGGPIAVTILGLIGVGVLLSPVPVLTAVGGRLLGWKRSGQASFLVAAVIWLALLFVPGLGILMLILTACAGLGAWATALFAGEHGPVVEEDTVDGEPVDAGESSSNPATEIGPSSTMYE